MLNILLDNHKPLKILALGAHCDDIEIGAGGTILSILERYEVEAVKWVVFTSTSQRKQEAQQSAELFLEKGGNKSIVIKDYRDGFLPYSAYEIKDYFETLKREINPDLIFTHYRDDRHQDHRLVSDLTWNTWRNHFILEYEIPKYDGDMGIPNFFKPLDSNIIDQKISILKKTFASQSQKHWFKDAVFYALPRLRGMECAANYAEAFYCRKVAF
ncbi:MAG: PIG-L deacetylase family protein [Cyclobacteriaceae bacterium]